MAVHNVRFNNARIAARAFLESIFSEVGSEFAFSDISTRAIKAGVASSNSILNNVCVEMTNEGFLTRTKKGVYARTDTRGTALPLPEPVPVPPPSAPSADALEVIRLAGIDSRIVGLSQQMDGMQGTLNQILDLLTAPK